MANSGRAIILPASSSCDGAIPATRCSSSPAARSRSACLPEAWSDWARVLSSARWRCWNVNRAAPLSPPRSRPRCWSSMPATSTKLPRISQPWPKPSRTRPSAGARKMSSAAGRRTQAMIETDLLVVGSGAAGFSAALTASHAGLSVLMVEKERQFGGTTAYSAGVIWIPGNRHGRALGIANSKEEALTYLQHEAGNRLNLELANAFLDNCNPAVEFIENNTLRPLRGRADLGGLSSDQTRRRPGRPLAAAAAVRRTAPRQAVRPSCVRRSRP